MKRRVFGFTDKVPDGLGGIRQRADARQQLGHLGLLKTTQRDRDGNLITTKSFGDLFRRVIYDPIDRMPAMFPYRGLLYARGYDKYGCLGLGNGVIVTATTYPDNWEGGTLASVYFTSRTPDWVDPGSGVYDANEAGDVAEMARLRGLYGYPAESVLTGAAISPALYAPWDGGTIHLATLAELPIVDLVENGMLPPNYREIYAGFYVTPFQRNMFSQRYDYMTGGTFVYKTDYSYSWPVVPNLTLVSGIRDPIFASTAGGASFVIDKNHRMFCCGGNVYGGLGIGAATGVVYVGGATAYPTYYTTRFVQVPGKWRMVHTDGDTTIAIAFDWTVWAAGYGYTPTFTRLSAEKFDGMFVMQLFRYSEEGYRFYNIEGGAFIETPNFTEELPWSYMLALQPTVTPGQLAAQGEIGSSYIGSGGISLVENFMSALVPNFPDKPVGSLNQLAVANGAIAAVDVDPGPKWVFSAGGVLRDALTGEIDAQSGSQLAIKGSSSRGLIQQIMQ